MSSHYLSGPIRPARLVAFSEVSSVALSFIQPLLAIQKQSSSSKILLKVLGLGVLHFPSQVSLNAAQWYAGRERDPVGQQTD